MKSLKTRGGEYESPKIEVISVTVEQGFAGSGDIPEFDEPVELSWIYYGEPTE